MVFKNLWLSREDRWVISLIIVLNGVCSDGGGWGCDGKLWGKVIILGGER